MRLLGNLIWLVFGGLVMGLGWWLCGLLCFISIIGIPWGKACFVLGQFTMWPFGREAVSRSSLTQQQDIGTGTLGLLGNIIWFLVCGFWLALGHVATGLLFCLTIIGIPFGIQHFKLALIALAPIGQTIVDKR